MKSEIHIAKHRWRGLGLGLGVAFVVTALVAGIYEWGFEPAKPPVAHEAISSRQVIAGQPIENKPSHRPTELHAPQPGETRTEQIDRLARGTPADALQAVKILQACANVEPYALHAGQAQDPKLKELLTALAPAGNCQGVTPGQRTQAIPLAIKAAEARVPGAFGQLLGMSLQDDEIKNDPRVQQSWSAILEANLKAADPDALMARFQYESNCSDPPKCTGRDLRMALVHWTAYVDAKGLKYGRDTVTPQLTAVLGSEEAQAAIAQGHSAYKNRSQP